MTAPSPFTSFTPSGEGAQSRFRTPSFAKPVEDETPATPQTDPVLGDETSPAAEPEPTPDNEGTPPVGTEEAKPEAPKTKRARKTTAAKTVDAAPSDGGDTGTPVASPATPDGSGTPQQQLGRIIAGIIESQPPQQALETLESLKSGLDTATSVLDQHLTTVGSLVKGLL